MRELYHVTSLHNVKETFIVEINESFFIRMQRLFQM